MLGKLLIRYLKKYRWLLLGVLVFQFISAMASLYLPRLNADIIDQGVAKGDTAYIWSTGMVMLVISLGQIIAAIIATYFAARSSMAAGRDIRFDIYEKVSGFSEREVSKFGPGSLITRNTNDVQQVQMLAMMGATMLVTAPLLAIGGIYHGAPAGRRAQLADRRLRAAAARCSSCSSSAAWCRCSAASRRSSMPSTASCASSSPACASCAPSSAKTSKRSASRSRTPTSWSSAARSARCSCCCSRSRCSCSTSPSSGVIWFGAIQVDAGTVEIGTLFAFMQYVGQILMGVLMASFMTIMIPRAAVSAERIGEVLASESTLTRAENPVSDFAGPGHGRVRRRRVHLSRRRVAGAAGHHASRRSAVRRSRSSGSTGSGKTTLVSLIPRLFDVTGGAVRVGGVDVREADLDYLWKGIGLVPQRPFLFSGTVASNLRFGREEATDEELWKALEIAQGKDFVEEMEGQLNARIAQGGTNVSGGQRQRLAIARAIIHQPDVLVFDDSFSALDLSTDARLRQALWRELPEVTKIVVAQRVSTITDADRIVVLEDGRMVGVGTHEELLETSETYREIVESQLGVEA